MLFCYTFIAVACVLLLARPHGESWVALGVFPTLRFCVGLLCALTVDGTRSLGMPCTEHER